jgi:hypothetical protein
MRARRPPLSEPELVANQGAKVPELIAAAPC